MTADQEISNLEDELSEARTSLHDTLNEVNEKLGHAEAALRPDNLIRRYPVWASGLVGTLGFLVGSKTKSLTVVPAVALLAYALWRVSEATWE